MATIKSFTSLEQSKKLAKILPLESADMCCFQNPNGSINYYGFPFLQGNKTSNPIPCWSLAALLSVLPQGEYKDAVLCCGGYEGDEYIPEWFCSYEQQEPFIIEICHAANPVDACYEMIIRLHELKML